MFDPMATNATNSSIMNFQDDIDEDLDQILQKINKQNNDGL